MRRSNWSLVAWSALIVLWMCLIATVDCRTYTGSCGQAKAGNIAFLGLVWLVGVLVFLGVRSRTQIKAAYRARFGSANSATASDAVATDAVAVARVARQQPGLLEARAGRFSAMHNSRWLLPGNTGPHILAIRRGLFGGLGITVDGQAVAGLGRMGLGGVWRTSEPISVDGHQVVVYGQYVLRQSGLAGAFSMAAYYFDVFVDGWSLLDGSGIGVLAGRAAAAQVSPAAQFYGKLWAPTNVATIMTVGEAAALTREHGFLAGWLVLLVGNVVVLQVAVRCWKWARAMPSYLPLLRGFIVGFCVIGLAEVILAATLVAQRL